jgi:threonine synthase
VDVFILYPKGKVSPLQEKQLTTLGGNIHALEIDGVFDDCQQLVKSAFLDVDLNKKLTLTSANSINIARWLPQSVYYHWGWAQAPRDMDVVFSVPSGNYGNLTAGLLAKKMGLPVHWFIAASNANDAVPVYLGTGKFEPRPSISTISNAMDVGNPSNFQRLTHLYDDSYTNIIREIRGYSYSDKETAQCIQDVYAESGYLMDPHGAIGYLGLQTFDLEDHEFGIFLETAHPAKFDQTLTKIIGTPPEIPGRLAERMEMTKMATPLSYDYDVFKDWLLNHALI